MGMAPIPCPTRCMLVLCTGKITKKPIVENDQIVIKDMMTCCFTLDHRYGDAAIAIKIVKVMKAYIEDPENFKLEDWPDSMEAETKKIQ